MNSIVFIHDMFHNSNGWKKWTAFFKKRGYHCQTIEWPDYEALSRKTNQRLSKEQGDLYIERAFTAFENVAKSIESPIFIGHSIGGLMVQKLISSGLGTAGICIDSVEPDSMSFFDWGFIDNSIMISNPFHGDELFFADFEGFHEKFCGTMSVEEAKALFYIYNHKDINKSEYNYTNDEGDCFFGEPHSPLLFINSEETFISQTQDENDLSGKFFGLGPLTFGDEDLICGKRDWKEIAESVHVWLQQQEVLVNH